MKKNIALVTGGYSSESQVSYKSCDNVIKHVDKSKFICYRVELNKTGWYCRFDEAIYDIDKNDFSVNINKEKIIFDLCYIIIHGTPGEDGRLQGYFDLIGQKYISCSCAVSSLAFNKFYTTSFLRSLGFNVANSILIVKNRYLKSSKNFNKFNFPVFVKPNNGGSSIGISRVDSLSDMDIAVNKGFEEDDQLIVEEQILGQEFTIGAYSLKGQVFVLPITEIKSENSFFDFDAKYKGKSVETTPANINANIRRSMELLAIDIYNKMQCAGVVRIDVILEKKTKKLFVLEVNTIPGQTTESIIPKQVKASGITMKQFYTKLFLDHIK